MASLRAEFEPVARAAAETYGVDPDLFVRLITQESGWQDDVIYGSRVSSAGAEGIAQIMRAYHPGVEPLEPYGALDYAARHLAGLVSYFGGDVGKGVAAYNAGAGGVENAVARGGGENWQSKLPDETKQYLGILLGEGDGMTANWPELITTPIGTRGAVSPDVRFPDMNDPRYQKDVKDAYGLPTGEKVFDRALYEDDVYALAEAYAQAGYDLPSGSPELARIFYAGVKRVTDKANDPLARQQAELALFAYQREIDKDYESWPTQMDQLKANLAKTQQDIRLSEPIGDEAVLRTEAGQQGWEDYLRGQGPSEGWTGHPDERQYIAGYNLARTRDTGSALDRENLDLARRGVADEERRTDLQQQRDADSRLASYMDQVIKQIGADMEGRKMRLDQVNSEFSRKLSAFDSGATAFRDIQPYTVPITPGGHVYGLEPGGIGTQLGLAPMTQGQTTSYDPFQMAIDIVNSTPSPLDIGVPYVPPAVEPGGFDPFAYATDIWRRNLDEGVA